MKSAISMRGLIQAHRVYPRRVEVGVHAKLLLAAAPDSTTLLNCLAKCIRRPVHGNPSVAAVDPFFLLSGHPRVGPVELWPSGPIRVSDEHRKLCSLCPPLSTWCSRRPLPWTFCLFLLFTRLLLSKEVIYSPMAFAF